MTEDNILAVATYEGGLWIPLSDCNSRVIAILFKDGTTWDEISGFRGKLMDYTPASLKIVQSNWS